jgi:hypothetical protein
MGSRRDAFSPFDSLLASSPPTDPWRHEPGGGHRHQPDWALLCALLAGPVAAGLVSESGRFARAIDAWIAHELRRIGFGADDIWPRPMRPRVMPHDVAMLLERLPAGLADELRLRLPDIAAVGPVDARVLGRAYEKQVDVCMSRWDTGPELLISTKAQTGSFGKNLPNRFEEAYGDAGNLRGRHPLAAVGFVFVQRATILDREPAAFERTLDMMRKLRDRGDGNGYTATALILVDWDEQRESRPRVAVVEDAVPEDIGAGGFFAAMTSQVLAAAPVARHRQARELIERSSGTAAPGM